MTLQTPNDPVWPVLTSVTSCDPCDLQVNAGHVPSGISWMFSRATPEALKAEEEKLGKQLHQLKVELEVSYSRIVGNLTRGGITCG